jgi:hypothetical protein
MADAGLLRKRLRAEIDAARKASATRRERGDQAARDYEIFLDTIAVPAIRTLSNIMRAEGVPFEAQTPSGAVRLVSDRFRDDAIEMILDTTLDPPAPMLLSTRTRGSRVLRSERPVKEGAAIQTITEDDLIERLIEELRPWLA